MARSKSLPETLFWKRVNKNGPSICPDLGRCWNWIGGDRFWFGKHFWRAVQVSWFLAHGPWSGMVERICGNSSCVRPTHLRLVESETKQKKMFLGRGEIERFFFLLKGGPFEPGVEFRSLPDRPLVWVGKNGSVYGWNRRKRQVSKIPQRKTAGKGYIEVTLPGGEKRLVHRLVLESWKGPCPPGMECRHFPDGNPENNNLENLSWGTKMENTADRIVHGTNLAGFRHPKTKASQTLTRTIRGMLKDNAVLPNGKPCKTPSGHLRLKAISKLLEVDRTVVLSAVRMLSLGRFAD